MGKDSGEYWLGFAGIPAASAFFAIVAFVLWVRMRLSLKSRERASSSERDDAGEDARWNVVPGVVLLSMDQDDDDSYGAMGHLLADSKRANSQLTYGVVEEILEERGVSDVDEKEGDEICTICLDNVDESGARKRFISPSCHHWFHLSCISQWIYKSQMLNCPNCQSKILEVRSSFNSKERGFFSDSSA